MVFSGSHALSVNRARKEAMVGSKARKADLNWPKWYSIPECHVQSINCGELAGVFQLLLGDWLGTGGEQFYCASLGFLRFYSSMTLIIIVFIINSNNNK